MPSVSLPKGGGAIRGIGEKFTANPSNGTASLAVPVATSPGRAGFDLQLSLAYDSGAGNGPFGMGWHLSAPAITRKTDKGLPRYLDHEESDVFVLSGAEDLVPVPRTGPPETHEGHEIRRYRPRVEGLFARIERWTHANSGETHWRVTTRDNVLNIYGRTGDARIADPDDGRRVFSWLLEETRDERGNVAHYRYKPEDGAGVDPSRPFESNRFAQREGGAWRLRSLAQRYLKRIRYGNRAPIGRDQPTPQGDGEWLFEVVFDYGEHHPTAPRPDDDTRAAWPVRADPFSNCRAGFEVRTWRLCRRVLMFHRFAELGTTPCLVRSTDLSHDEHPVVTTLRSVTQRGYVRASGAGPYTPAEMPPLEFEYSKAVVHDTPRAFDAESLEGIPAGVDWSGAQWADLDGEGIPGALIPVDRAWYYKPARGEGRLAPPVVQGELPALADLRGGAQQLTDLEGDGQLDLVRYTRPLAGTYERTEDGGWAPFAALPELPNIAWGDPNLRFVDLDGDGHPDVLITEDAVFVWYRSRAKEGFEAAAFVARPLDEREGPAVLFADGAETIHLADMSGDGLADIVRVRNGEVCYWPNLGYGRFGRKVVLDGAPWFDHAELFDPKRVRFADIDGSGTSDVLYLGRDGVAVFFNQSGNALSTRGTVSRASGEVLEDRVILRGLPLDDTLSSVSVVDLLGQGTACLVWSSTGPASLGRPLAYIDLMGGQKPHLLLASRNNLGAETRVRYAPSTRFYLADKHAGRPWITRLAFPVQVVERVETIDRISRNRFVTRYAYHHGYFDGHEREFRGFGMVEQWDTEEVGALNEGGLQPADDNFDAASYVPPVLTRTWFHTGVFLERLRLARRYEPEFYREDGITDEAFRAQLLPGVPFPREWGIDEMREACRALKGSILRQEIYGLDGTPRALLPYTVSERDYAVRRLQAPEGGRHGVFLVFPRESLEYHYERGYWDDASGTWKNDDPRVAHALTLDVDDYGNVRRSASVGYGRARVDASVPEGARRYQADLLATCTESDLTRDTSLPPRDVVDTPDAWRTPLPCETRTYELVGLRLPAGHARLTFDAVDAATRSPAFPYEGPAPAPALPAPSPHRRLVERERVLYRRDDLTGPLPLGVMEPRAIPYEKYKLAYTAGLVAQLYQRRAGEAPLVDDATLLEGGYVHLDGDADWWIPSGRTFLSPDPAHTPVQELAYARDHFFMPRRSRDRFAEKAAIPDDTVALTYDRYDLLAVEVRDAVGNVVTAGERDPAGALTRNGNDYRVLQPTMVMDPNRNRAAVAFDARGLVVGTAVMGKPEESLGDSLVGFRADLSDAEIAAYVTSPLTDPHALLARATTRIVHDLFAYQRTRDDLAPQPPVVCTLSRETHDADLALGQRTKIQHAITYSDGFGREVQKKLQAEPGPLTPGGASVSSRWVGSGWTVFNNKGKPVRKYEPFFSGTHAFEFGRAVGVSPVVFYDTAGRAVATLHPDHTWEMVAFGPWSETRWDANDTTLVSDPKTDPDVGGFFRRLPDADYLPSWHEQRAGGARGPHEQRAAQKSAVHAATPTTVHLDTLGRPFLTVAHNRFERDGVTTAETSETRILLDIEGNEREVVDALGRIVMRYAYDMLGHRARQESMEAGTRWGLGAIDEKPLRSWDSRGHTFEFEHDALRRPTTTHVRGADPDDRTRRVLYGETKYGEGEPDAVATNLRSRTFLQRDGAGEVTNRGTVPGTTREEAYDFKGNLLRSVRQLAREYRRVVDWSDAVGSILEPETYTTATRYDALNRPAEMTAPDRSRIVPTYNEANLLERVEVALRGASTLTPFVTNIDYDAKGQRERVEHGNGARTRYEYDPLTFRMRRLFTTRGGGAEALQDLQYTYDPVGNIARITDDAQQTIFFAGRRVEPSADYTYDALYRLIEATGREHLGQLAGGGAGPPLPGTFSDAPRVRRAHPNDANAMGTYLERYTYDLVGNFLELLHRGSDPVQSGWTRSYAYNERSLLEPTRVSNRLSSTEVTGGGREPFPYDAHGNMRAMGHLPTMTWDCLDHLASTAQQVVGGGGTPETTYYTYDTAGQRVRKVTERQAAAGQAAARLRERVYVGPFEVYREYGGNDGSVSLERETLHVMDDKRRVASVETRTRSGDLGAPPLTRYQYDNYPGSVCLELDGSSDANILSYEEYYPYGGTAYHGITKQVEVPKRYRYTGKERDDETGAYYHGARYYAPWLGKWLSPDPIGVKDSINSYQYVSGNPIRLSDPSGRSGWDRFWGGVKAVGGVLEFAAGASLTAAGAATSEIGMGIPLMAAGVFVMGHGADTTVSGARTAWHGRPIDTLTSQALQSRGVSRPVANLADAGISVVGTMGAGLLTRGAGTASSSISVAFRPAAGPGHNMVGITTEAGTQWSHLVIGGNATRTSGVVTSGEALVVASEAGPGAGYAVTTVPVSAARAQAALSSAEAQVATQAAGEYSLMSNNCATYASGILREAGVARLPVSTPSLTFVTTALQSPRAALAGSAIDTAVGVRSSQMTSTPPRRAPRSEYSTTPNYSPPGATPAEIDAQQSLPPELR